MLREIELFIGTPSVTTTECVLFLKSELFIGTPSVTLALSAFTTTTVSLFFFNNTCTRAYTHPRVNVGQLWIVVLFLPVFSSLVFFLVENDATRRNVLYKCRVDPANNFYQV